jgi:hypothetical protein
MSYAVKKAFNWHRAYSCIPGAIEIPAGAPVRKGGQNFWLDPSFFGSKLIEKHDATYYGCLVSPDNVEEVL